MEINPIAPSMNYTADGFPLSSDEAFKLYARTEEFESLKTDDKTIIGAINELVEGTDKFVENVEETSINGLTTTSKTVEGAINELDASLKATDLTVGEIQGDVTALQSDVSSLSTVVEGLVKPTLTLNEVSFTDPNYFKAKGTQPPVIVNDDYVAFSFVCTVEQDIQYTDNNVEIVNLNFNDSAVVDLTKMPTSFYIPARITYFDNNGDFVKNVSTLLEARWEQALSSYDISVYLHDVVDNNGSTTKPEIYFSGIVPYIATNVNEGE